jgi:transcriptional regulator with XRE-family HTH domain
MPEAVERRPMGPDRHRTPLQRERQRRGWTLEYVADELRRLGWKSADPNAVSRHERGIIRRPRAPVPDLYAKLYGKPVAALWPEDGVVAWVDVSDASEELPELTIRRVNDNDVDRIRSDTDVFGLMDQRHGGGHVRWMVAEYLRREVAARPVGTVLRRHRRLAVAVREPMLLTPHSGACPVDTVCRRGHCLHRARDVRSLTRPCGRRARARRISPWTAPAAVRTTAWTSVGHGGDPGGGRAGGGRAVGRLDSAQPGS